MTLILTGWSPPPEPASATPKTPGEVLSTDYDVQLDVHFVTGSFGTRRTTVEADPLELWEDHSDPDPWQGLSHRIARSARDVRRRPSTERAHVPPAPRRRHVRHRAGQAPLVAVRPREKFPDKARPATPIAADIGLGSRSRPATSSGSGSCAKRAGRADCLAVADRGWSPERPASHQSEPRTANATRRPRAIYDSLQLPELPQ